jgi:hypothetical protein
VLGPCLGTEWIDKRSNIDCHVRFSEDTKNNHWEAALVAQPGSKGVAVF